MYSMLRRFISTLRELYICRDSSSFVSYLIKRGADIGSNVYFVAPLTCYIDLTRPAILSIGNKVTITRDVTILTHGFEWSVLREKYGRQFASAKPTRLGNNIFIGMGSTILGGSVIEDNVIVGAGSVVRGELEGNYVYAGNPAVKVMSLQSYYEKMVLREKTELSQLVKLVCDKRFEYKEYYFSEHFFMFAERNQENAKKFEKHIGVYSEIFFKTEPQFKGLSNMLKYYHQYKI